MGRATGERMVVIYSGEPPVHMEHARNVSRGLSSRKFSRQGLKKLECGLANGLIVL